MTHDHGIRKYELTAITFRQMTGFKCAGLADKALEFVPRFTCIVSTVIFSTASALFATPFVQFDNKRAHPELSGYSEQIVPPSEHNHAAGVRQARKTGFPESESIGSCRRIIASGDLTVSFGPTPELMPSDTRALMSFNALSVLFEWFVRTNSLKVVSGC